MRRALKVHPESTVSLLGVVLLYGSCFIHCTGAGISQQTTAQGYGGPQKEMPVLPFPWPGS